MFAEVYMFIEVVKKCAGRKYKIYDWYFAPKYATVSTIYSQWSFCQELWSRKYSWMPGPEYTVDWLAIPIIIYASSPTFSVIYNTMNRSMMNRALACPSFYELDISFLCCLQILGITNSEDLLE